MATFAAMRMIRDELGVNMCVGASNVSFGLPDRHTLNAAFLPMAMAAGLDRGDHVDRRCLRAQRARGRPAARSRRVGSELDRRPSRAPGGGAGGRAERRERGGAAGAAASRGSAERCATSRRARAGRRQRARPAEVPAGRRRGARARAGRRCSTPQAGTGSRSTRPAAATAPARSARCGSSQGTCPSGRSIRAPSRARNWTDGWRLACRAAAREDLVVEVPPLQTRPKAALAGVGRHVILRPSVQKRHLVLEEPTLEDQRPDIERRAGRDRRPRAVASVGLLRTLGRHTAVIRVRRDRGGRGRGADRRRARRHDSAALRDRLRPRHHDGGGDAARIWTPGSRWRSARCSTVSSRSAPT